MMKDGCRFSRREKLFYNMPELYITVYLINREIIRFVNRVTGGENCSNSSFKVSTINIITELEIIMK